MKWFEEHHIKPAGEDKRAEAVNFTVEDLAQCIENIVGEIEKNNLIKRVSFNKFSTAEKEGDENKNKDDADGLPGQKKDNPDFALKGGFEGKLGQESENFDIFCYGVHTLFTSIVPFLLNGFTLRGFTLKGTLPFPTRKIVTIFV